MEQNTATETAALEFLTIQLAAERAMPIAEGVTLVHGQGAIYFDVDARNKSAAVAAKRAVGAFLLDAFPHRKFTHVKKDGYKLWHLRFSSGHASGDLRCGIRIALTDEERHSICLGPLVGVNCVARARRAA